jgi:tetratricopeptide (TPR) repeat protein
VIARSLLASALAASLLVLGCATQASDPGSGAAPGSQACACEPAAPVVDPTLLAFLSKARAAHHEADLAEEKQDREQAVRALLKIVEGPRPAGEASPEVAEVIADTRARLADLRSALGDFERARADVDEGLKLAPGVTHFRGHLIEVRGLVEERRAKALKEKGDEAGALRARDEALKAFQEAIDIQDQVIAEALKQKEKGEPPKPAPR